MSWTGTCVTSILSMNCKIFLKNKINIHLIFFSRCSFVKIFQEIWTVDSPGNCCVFGGLPECEEERPTKECILGTSSSSRRNSGEVLLKSTYITNVKRANFSLLLSNCLWDFERAEKMAKMYVFRIQLLFPPPHYHIWRTHIMSAIGLDVLYTWFQTH